MHYLQKKKHLSTYKITPFKHFAEQNIVIDLIINVSVTELHAVIKLMC